MDNIPFNTQQVAFSGHHNSQDHHSLHTDPQAVKRCKFSHHSQLGNNASSSNNCNDNNEMDVADEAPKTMAGAAGVAAVAEAESDESDWDDWADAMVAQGEPADTVTATGGAGEVPGGAAAAGEEEEEAWVKSMMDQGTDRSVVQDADSRAWDYVLQMAVEKEQQYVSTHLFV